MRLKERLKANLANIFTMKAIVTMAVVFVFLFKVLRGEELGGDFMMIFAVVVTYWLCEKTKGREEQ